MSDGSSVRRPGLSVFGKLMAIMLAIAIIIPVLVGGFVLLVARPAVNQPLNGLMVDYMESVAATSPNLATAKTVGARFGLKIRYEGPSRDTAWSTAEDLPPIQQVHRAGSGSGWAGAPSGFEYYVVERADGSTYLFAWEFRHEIDKAHTRFLGVLLAALVAVVLFAHAMLRRSLQPLRWLREGVAKLSEGNLEVTVPRRSGDEFGALTDAFNHMVGQVREMVTSRDQLLLDVSHELRSPLTRMKVALALCSDDPHHKRLSADVAELEAMVTELLELEQLRQGKGLQIEQRDLMEVVRGAVDQMKDRGPGVEICVSPAKALVWIDPIKVRRVLINLLENAAKFSRSDSLPVTLTVTHDDREVVVRVKDDGPGIPAQDLPSLFEPFFRVDRSRSRKTGGYGLGLSFCKRIMNAHAGSIAVENNPVRGATFTLTFPRQA